MYAVWSPLAFTSKSQSHFGTALRNAMFCVLTILKLYFGVFMSVSFACVVVYNSLIVTQTHAIDAPNYVMSSLQSRY